MRLASRCITLLVALLTWHAQYAFAAETQPQLAGGTAADLELKTFGAFVQVGGEKTIRPNSMGEFLLAMILTMYQTSSQYAQVLRICTYSESIAQDEDSRQTARICRSTALLNLGRYAEAEELLYAQGEWDGAHNSKTLLDQINRLSLMTEISLNQGNLSLASKFTSRLSAVIPEAKRPQAYPKEALPDIVQGMETMRLRSIADSEANVQVLATRIAYFEQDADVFQKQLDKLMALSVMDEHDRRGVVALEHANELIAMQHGDIAKANAVKYLPVAEASAGFRDVPKPLTDFKLLESAAATLGDGRTQPQHVISWLRLVKTYLLLGRIPEAARLLEATKELARKYEIEELASSSLMASVDEMTSDLAIQQGQMKAAIEALRAARQRYVLAGVAERSSTLGRRSLPFNSKLLAVDARLLHLIAQTEVNPIRDNQLRQELIEIAADFSVSRADLSVRQAGRSVDVVEGDIQAELKQEGVLIDELIELRGKLAAVSNNADTRSTTDRQAIQARMSTVMNSLRDRKAVLAQKSKSISNADMAYMATQIPPGTVFWQWIIHPMGNCILAITSDGIWLSPFEAPLSDIRNAASTLGTALSPSKNWEIGKIPAYPTTSAHQLYQVLFAPIAPRLPAARHWVIAPPALLDRIPWAALVVDKGVPGTGPTWLADKTAITVTPSFSAWGELIARRRSNARRDFLGIGDPIGVTAISLASLSTRGSYIADVSGTPVIHREESSSFGRELKAARSLFDKPNTLLLARENATKAAILNTSLADYRIILFSTHGLTGQGISNTVGPSLILSKGAAPRDALLTANEIARLSLDSDLVILSACDTGASDGFAATEGFSGLTSSFLLAGARTVVATLWPVETTSTESIMGAALSEYQRHPTDAFAFALQKSMQEKAHGERKEFRHPYFWAGFVSVGR